MTSLFNRPERLNNNRLERSCIRWRASRRMGGCPASVYRDRIKPRRCSPTSVPLCLEMSANPHGHAGAEANVVFHRGTALRESEEACTAVSVPAMPGWGRTNSPIVEVQFSSLATRNPRLVARNLSSPPQRYEELTNSSGFSHEPPRNTRFPQSPPSVHALPSCGAPE